MVINEYFYQGGNGMQLVALKFKVFTVLNKDLVIHMIFVNTRTNLFVDYAIILSGETLTYHCSL